MKNNNNNNRIPESKEILRVESGFLGFEIWNSAKGVRNPSVRIGILNPESKTVLFYLTWSNS